MPNQNLTESWKEELDAKLGNVPKFDGPPEETYVGYPTREWLKTFIENLLLSQRERLRNAINIEYKEWKDIGLPMSRESFTHGGDWANYREGAVDATKRAMEVFDRTP